MKRPTPRQIRIIIGSLTVAATLLGVDIWAATRLVRGHLQLPIEPTSVDSVCPPDGGRGGRELVLGTLTRLARAKITKPPPCRMELHVPHERLLELSPFPPLLQELDSRSAGPVAGSAVLQTGREGQVQVTIVHGPADRTPSRFVPRAPGADSFTKRFQVTYLFVHESGSTLDPKQHFAAWRALEIGGDGKRIAALTIGFASAELVVLLMLAGAFLRGRHSARKQSAAARAG